MAGSDGEKNSDGKQSGRGNGANGKNGKHMNVETPGGENSVERSLEDFIARANSTFVDGEDGWDLSEEKKPEPVAAAAPAAASPAPAVALTPPARTPRGTGQLTP